MFPLSLKPVNAESKIDKKGREYLYYHTARDKIACKYPDFSFTNILPKNVENLRNEESTTSFPPESKELLKNERLYH